MQGGEGVGETQAAKVCLAADLTEFHLSESKRTLASARDAFLIMAAWMAFVAVLWQPSLQMALLAAGFCLAVPRGRDFLKRS